MELQHINVKIYSSTPEMIDLDEGIPIFHGWISRKACPELLIDVADYAHVPAGPGVMLIGHEAQYSIEAGAENRLGLLYATKLKQAGNNVSRIVQALGRAINACQMLQQEKLWENKVKFQSTDLYISVNDRYIAPNTQDTFEAVKTDIEEGLITIFGNDGFSIAFEVGDPRSLFQVNIKLINALDVAKIKV